MVPGLCEGGEQLLRCLFTYSLPCPPPTPAGTPVPIYPEPLLVQRGMLCIQRVWLHSFNLELIGYVNRGSASPQLSVMWIKHLGVRTLVFKKVLIILAERATNELKIKCSSEGNSSVSTEI